MKQVTFEESDLKKFLRLETKAVRFWRSVGKSLSAISYLALTFLTSFLLINGPAYWERLQYTARGAETTAENPPPPPAQPVIQYPDEIIIPAIGLRAPVIYGGSYEAILTDLERGVVQYQGTALPGQVGNLVLLGHSSNFPWAPGEYKTVFSLLDKLSLGHEIIVPHGSVRYRYLVTETKVVSPSELSVLEKTSYPGLTLITCYPIGTTRSRLIVRAELVEGAISGEQTSGPYLGESLPRPR